jgi:type VI secretion system secreted protein VgrG
VEIIPGILALSTALAIALSGSPAQVSHPAGVPACKPPWTFMFVNGWECIGGPGPVVLPTPGTTPAPTVTSSPTTTLTPATLPTPATTLATIATSAPVATPAPATESPAPTP